MINELRAEIKTQLGTLDSISSVYDYVPEAIEGFPAIVFNFDRVESGNQDTNSNERQYFFQINILQEIANFSHAEVEQKICEILDQVIDLLDKSDLGIKTEAVGGDIAEIKISNGPALIGTIVLNIHTIYNLS